MSTSHPGSAPSWVPGMPLDRRENLALLYQGVLTAVVRVQSGRQPIGDAASFRKRMKDALDQVAREAVRTGYESQDVADANYAVIAFLDEAVLNSQDPSHTQWQSIQSEMFEKAVAGEGFFERLNALRSRRDTALLADILEVYYLCLLLGYRGRYALAGEAELGRLMDELSQRIKSVRDFDPRLSPEAIPERPKQLVEKAHRSTHAWAWGVLMAACAVLVWAVFRLLLFFQTQEAATAIRNMHIL